MVAWDSRREDGSGEEETNEIIDEYLANYECLYKVQEEQNVYMEI